MRNQDTFIALGSPAARILDVLEDLIDFTCEHDHKSKCNQEGACEHEVWPSGFEEAAVRIADMIGKGEL